MNEQRPNKGHNDNEQPNGESTDHLDLNRVRHPEVTVRLSSIDGNAFGILGAVQQALRRAGVGKGEIDEFYEEATSGDYDHLLETCMRWVEVE